MAQETPRHPNDDGRWPTVAINLLEEVVQRLVALGLFIFLLLRRAEPDNGYGHGVAVWPASAASAWKVSARTSSTLRASRSQSAGCRARTAAAALAALAASAFASAAAAAALAASPPAALGTASAGDEVGTSNRAGRRRENEARAASVSQLSNPKQTWAHPFSARVRPCRLPRVRPSARWPPSSSSARL